MLWHYLLKSGRASGLWETLLLKSPSVFRQGLNVTWPNWCPGDPVWPVIYIENRSIVVLAISFFKCPKIYYHYYYYYKICIAHKFKRARVRDAGVARWGTWLAGERKQISFKVVFKGANSWIVPSCSCITDEVNAALYSVWQGRSKPGCHIVW